MNKVILLGRISKDLDVRYTQANNSMVVYFSLAVRRKFTQGEKQADFINIVCFGKTAEFCNQYFSKGQQIALTGRLQNTTYEDKNGNRKTVIDVIAEEVYFADSKRENTEDNMDDMPF